MDILKKIELLLNAATRAKLPRRDRPSPLDEQEQQLLAEIRQAVAQVQTQERMLAERLKSEQAQAETAAQQQDWDQQRTHQRRAEELERQLNQESIQAINLEEKLAALEEKLALARAAVEKEARKAAARSAEADQVLAQGQPDAASEPGASSSAEKRPAAPSPGTDADLAARKSRLSD
jgi:septal ring factor EnvC (AmiA/AmiB activator)